MRPDTEMDDFLRTNLSRCIEYAKSSNPELQRQIAEKLANEAVKPHRQEQIVKLDGLELLLPLTQSRDPEVKRLAAHALANLSVNADNQVEMASRGGVEMLVELLHSSVPQVQRQSSKVRGRLSEAQ